MSVSQSPFRVRRCFTLIIAMMVTVTSSEKPVVGQGVTDPKTIASPDESTQSAGATPAVEPTKTTFIFSPIEMMPIRRSEPEITLPPEIAARRSEIERKMLERIFSGGMILSESNRDVQPPERHPAMIVAWAPQETVLPQSPSRDKMIDAGVLGQPSALSSHRL